MEEKTLLEGEKKSAIIVSLTAGVGVAIVIFAICMCIWEPKYYWDTSLFGAAVSGAVIFLIVFFWIGRTELVVTDKRVYGRAAFGKRVDLPIDSIAAVGMSALNGVMVTTASGMLSFKLMANNKELHKCISNLLIERQNRTTLPTTIKQEVSHSDADELKKFKELLDSGVITQEEFEAKKNKILAN